MTQRLGDSRLEFGSTDETWGLIQSISSEEVVEESPARDGSNDIVAVEQTNKMKNVSFQYIYRNQDTGISPTSNVGNGTQITFQTSGDIIYIKSCTQDWSNGDWRQVSGEGSQWPNLNS